MEKKFDVVVIGELNVDLILRGDVTPVFGQVEKLIDDASLTVGSSSAIFACGAARLGLNVAFIGKVGRDTFGEFMISALHNCGIDTGGVIVDAGIKTGMSVILAQPAQAGGGADRAILTHPGGSIGGLRAREIDDTIIARSRHLHYASYFLQESMRPDVLSVFLAAKHGRLTISLDTNYDPDEEWDGGLAEILPLVDIFLPNETEALAISRMPTLAQALDWLALRVPLSAVKIGARGSIARRGAECWEAGPLPIKVVDTVGAGDNFDAGFIYGYLAGWPPQECLRLANACGALSTRAAGGTAAQASLEEAKKAMA